MPNYTEILGLEQPFQDENYNVDVFNENARKIDEYMIPLAAPAEVEIEGRTLVNLLGRAGNAIYKQSGTPAANVTQTFDGDKTVLTLSSGANGSIKCAELIAGKFYIMVGTVKLVSGTNAYCSLYPTDVGFSKFTYVATPGETSFVYFIGKASASAYANLAQNGAGSSEFKNVALYEITQAEYTAIQAMTAEQVAAKYPYVDDVKPVVNPYIESKENLLDNLSFSIGSFSVGDPNVAVTNPGAISSNMIYNIKMGTYTVGIEGEYVGKFKLNMFIYSYTHAREQFVTNMSDATKTYTTVYGGDLRLYIDTGELDTGVTLDSILKSLNTGKTKITLVKGTTPKPYDECHNSRIMFETKLYSGEKISRKNDGQYVKNSEVSEYVIGSDTISYSSSVAGYKTFVTSNPTLLPCDNTFIVQCVRYDGKIIKKGFVTTEESFGTNSVNYYIITLPNTLTGWGDAYTPTADEIKAFFLGWRMVDSATGLPFNGTNKAWWKLWCGIGTNGTSGFAGVIPGTGTSVLPTTLNDQGYTPYKLIYKKATPTLEEVKVHGALDVSPDDVLTVGSGLVLGELVYPNDRGNGVIYVGDTLNRNSYTRFRNETFLMAMADNENTFVSVVEGLTQYIVEGRGKCVLQVSKIGKDNIVDYLIYKPDTVQSFDYTITTDDDFKTVVEKLVEENSAVNAQLAKTERELVRAKIELSQRSNPNLLINGDFQVWQRGNTITPPNNTALYTCDRWYHISNGSIASVEKTNSGIKLTKLSKIGTYHFLGYLFETGISDRLRGKRATLSAKLRSGKCKISVSNAFSSGSVGAAYVKDATLGHNSVTGTIPTHNYNYLAVAIDITDLAVGESVEIEWIKLELGEYATPFVPRTYAEELAMCQRYYQSISVDGVATTASVVHCNKMLPILMRTVPTFTPYGLSVQTEGVGTVNITGLSSTLIASRFSYFTIIGATLTVNRPYTAFGALDAEIY